MAEPGQKRSFNLMHASDLGIRLAITILIFTYGGYRLDQWRHSSPLYILVGALLGFGSGTWLAVRAVDRITGVRRGSESRGESRGSPVPDRRPGGPDDPD